MRRSFPGVFVFALFALRVLLTNSPSVAQYRHFESPPVHPVELSPSGQLLLAAHTADHRLVVYDVQGLVPVRIAEILVGLEPVTVRARTESEAWVVNHFSDSISVVDLSTGLVVATLLVGDEPTDVVFAGSPQRAFVSISQEDRIAVFDPLDLGAPPLSVSLSGSDPRSLAVAPDGGTVYVTIHESGNETTVVPFLVVDALGGPPAPDPPLKTGLPAPPRTSLIVRHDGSSWRDEMGQSWDAAIGYTLLDHDLIAIDANSLIVAQNYRGVGTTLFNVAVHPIDGTLYVSNQEAFNEIRFEPNLRGRFAANRISVIDPISATVTVRDLNTHIDHGNPTGSELERALSLAIPLDLSVSESGDLYVAALGSGSIGVLDASGTVVRRIEVGGGPAGLALDELGQRLFVLDRFASRIVQVDLGNDSLTEVGLGFDPTPPNARDGRRFLYDARRTSAHGDLACATCHIFAGMDNLAWDLGNPQGDMTPPPANGDPTGNQPDFHPMKGPMTTQSLKGLTETEPLHWRGDTEDLSGFNQAFVNLLGRSVPLDATEFQQFEDFIFSIDYPSNPFRELDGSLPQNLGGANPQNGEQLYLTGNLVGVLQCVSCHALPTGENGLIIPGNLLAEDEGKVVPQLRNLYEKTRFDDTALTNVRGFGFTHDGAVDDLFTFLDFPAFNFASDSDQRDVEAFLLCFDTGTPPALGAQWTSDGSSDPGGLARLSMLEAQADLGRIGLIAKSIEANGTPRGWIYGTGQWIGDRMAEIPLGTSTLLGHASSTRPITFTGVLDVESERLGIDRDLDGHLDADELDAGSDPGDPNSVPGEPTAAGEDRRLAGPSLWLVGSNPASSQIRFGFRGMSAGDPLTLQVFDLRGRLVRSLLRGSVEEQQMVAWDLRDDTGRTVSSGVYLARLQVRTRTAVARVVVVR